MIIYDVFTGHALPMSPSAVSFARSFFSTRRRRGGEKKNTTRKTPTAAAHTYTTLQYEEGAGKRIIYAIGRYLIYLITYTYA